MHISVKESNKKTEVEFIEFTQLKDAKKVGWLSSPIFPIVPGNEIPENTCHILFTFPKQPHSLIGKLNAKLNDDRIHKLWFSHGLASLIIISSDKNEFQEIKKLINDDIRGWEYWQLSNNLIVSQDYKKPTHDIVEIDIPDFSGLSVELQALLNEYYFCIKIAIDRASSYLPEHLRILYGLHDEVSKIIITLNHLSMSPIPNENIDFFPEEELETIMANPASKARSIHYLTDQILQINSTLGFVINQGYSGIIPILNHPCPIGTFSLLGVGTASTALVKIYESVGKIFGSYAIPKAIKESLKNDFSPIPIFINYSDYNQLEWKRYSNFLDGKIDKLDLNGNDLMFHLSYFSTTYGFRESLYSISAAVQSLFVGSTVEWTLLTLTHEFLHAHVRAIIAVLLPETSQDNFKNLYLYYEKLKSGVPEKELSLSAKDRLSLILLTISESIFHSHILSKKILDGKCNSQRSLLFTANTAYEIYKDNYKDLNEFLVHSLDYLYFYESNKALYTKLLWLTWATIPEVQEKLTNYLLRTLVALSIDHIDDPSERLLKAKGTIIKIFKDILNSGMCGNDLIIKSALEILEEYQNKSDENKKRYSALAAEYSGYIRLADMARYLLHSTNVHHDIKEDKLLSENSEGDLHYPIKTNEFQDIDINSPIAFIVDRAKKKLDAVSETSYIEALRENCWELLTIASSDLSKN